MLDQAFGFFDHHFGHLDVAGGGFVESGADDFAADAALHVGDFLGALVDQQHDERNLGVIGSDGVRDGLQQHGLAGARRGDDQAALAFADRREQVHHPSGEVIARGFELEPLIGIERGEVVEEYLVAGFFGRLEIDGVDFDQGKIAFALLGGANLAGDGVAGAQVEAANLRGRDVDVVGAWQIVVLGSAEEAEAVGQAFEHAFGEDQTALFGLGLEDLEDQLLLAQAGRSGDSHVLGDLVELLNAHILEFDQVQSRSAVLGLGGLFAALRARGSGDDRFGGVGWRRGCLGGRRRGGGGNFGSPVGRFFAFGGGAFAGGNGRFLGRLFGGFF